jgi:hypothetical protein
MYNEDDLRKAFEAGIEGKMKFEEWFEKEIVPKYVYHGEVKAMPAEAHDNIITSLLQSEEARIMREDIVKEIGITPDENQMISVCSAYNLDYKNIDDRAKAEKILCDIQNTVLAIKIINNEDMKEIETKIDEKRLEEVNLKVADLQLKMGVKP